MTNEEAVAAAVAASGLPEWVWIVGALLGSSVLTIILRLGDRLGASDKTEATKVAGMARFAPETERRSADTMLATMGEMQMGMEKMDTKLDQLLEIAVEEKREREEEEREELRELRRMAKRWKPPEP